MEAPRLSLDPFDDAFLADPYAHHETLREAGPVVWLDPIGAYGAARFAEVQAALRDHATFCSGRGVGLSDFSRETHGGRARCCWKPIHRCMIAHAA